VIELTGSSSQICHRPLPVDDPKQRKPDTRMAEATLGWRAQTPLRQGLGQTIGYFRELLAQAHA